MDEQEGLKLVAQVIRSDKEIDVKLPIRELWLIVSAFQLQITHPGLHAPLQTICEGIGRRLGALIVAELPQVGELLEMGWHREYDWIDDGDDDYDDEGFTEAFPADDGDYDDVDDLDDYGDADGQDEDNAPPSVDDIPW